MRGTLVSPPSVARGSARLPVDHRQQQQQQPCPWLRGPFYYQYPRPSLWKEQAPHKGRGAGGAGTDHRIMVDVTVTVRMEGGAGDGENNNKCLIK